MCRTNVPVHLCTRVGSLVIQFLFWLSSFDIWLSSFDVWLSNFISWLYDPTLHFHVQFSDFFLWLRSSWLLFKLYTCTSLYSDLCYRFRLHRFMLRLCADPTCQLLFVLELVVWLSNFHSGYPVLMFSYLVLF